MLSELGQESNSTLFIKTNCLQFKLALCRAKKKEKKRLQFTVCILFWKICLCRVQDNLQTQVCNCIITHVLTIQEKENFPDLEYLKWKSWSLWYACVFDYIPFDPKKRRRSTTIRLSLLCNLIRSWSPVGGVTQIIGLCNSATGWTAESHLV